MNTRHRPTARLLRLLAWLTESPVTRQPNRAVYIGRVGGAR